MNWQPPSVRLNDRPALIAFAEGLQKIRSTALQPPEEVNGLDWVEEHCVFSRETTGTNDHVELYGYQKGIIAAMTDSVRSTAQV